MSLQDRVAIITGSTGGLGRVVAKRLAEEGVRLALFSRSAEKLGQQIETLGLSEERVFSASVDLSNPNDLETAMTDAFYKFGQIDVLVHLVGGWTGGKTLIEAPVGDFTNMVDQHLWTTVNLIKSALPKIQTNNWGRMMVVSTPFAANPVSKMGPYAIGKAAQEALMLTLAQEIKGSGVTANILQVKTIDVKGQRLAEPTQKNSTWTQPEEITKTILYLCSDEAGMVNGARIPLYGSP